MRDTPIRGRFNAWLLDALEAYMHRKYGALKAQLFAPLPPTVVELGPGAGANLRYYPRGTRVVAIEPNVRMHDRLRRTAEKHGLELELHAVGAESLDLPSESADLVCATLVLCSLSEPARVMAEVRRVLRPDGRFVCIEHVAAPAGSAGALLQRTMRRPWRWLFEGCELRNRTETVLCTAGFRHVDIEYFEMSTVFLPLRYQIAATCTA
jgi:SAM-dependent methyltransferase